MHPDRCREQTLHDRVRWLSALSFGLDNVPSEPAANDHDLVRSKACDAVQGIKDSRTYVSTVYFVRNVLGVLLIDFCHGRTRSGCSSHRLQSLTGIGTTCYVLSLSQALLRSTRSASA
ncbi:hypothetical protein C8Q76DRAFT_247480 [Earliella scabrosa]|nr:hypothetical protein C8Q76DRAFT_247480 [Earliella scabrosa]